MQAMANYLSVTITFPTICYKLGESCIYEIVVHFVCGSTHTQVYSHLFTFIFPFYRFIIPNVFQAAIHFIPKISILFVYFFYTLHTVQTVCQLDFIFS